MSLIIMPPWMLQARARAMLDDQTAVDGRLPVDFTKPAGTPALVPPQSVSWRVFKNPVALFVGGVAAVFLELAEPRVRAGVWDFTNFRHDPVMRLRRTGLAAMVTVYGARDEAERMIAGVRRLHARAGHACRQVRRPSGARGKPGGAGVQAHGAAGGLSLSADAHVTRGYPTRFKPFAYCFQRCT